MAEHKAKRSGLGRGMDLLFPTHSDDGEIRNIADEINQSAAPQGDGKQVVILKLSEIEPNKGQPRKNFDTDKLTALRDSIMEHGIVQPILVTPTKAGTYRIVAGERRWRASKLAGLKEIPCIIRSFEEQEVMELALVENLQREDLNPIEEAEGYQQLMDTFQMTQDEISKRVGKSRSAVANALRLTHLSDAVKTMLVEGKLTQGHARALLPIEDPALQLELANRIVKECLNVRQTERMAAEIGSPKKQNTAKTKNPMMQKYYRDIEDALSSRFGTRVKIQEGAKKGKIEIEYYSKEDLERLLFALRR